MLSELFLWNLKWLIELVIFGFTSFVFGLYTWAMWDDHAGHDTWFRICAGITIVSLYMVFSRMFLTQHALTKRMDELLAYQKRQEERQIAWERSIEERERMDGPGDPVLDAAYEAAAAVIANDIADRAGEAVWGKRGTLR